MEAKGLMIGDWVQSRGKIEQVTSVYEGYICTDSFEDSHDYYFEPIPPYRRDIGEEWVEECSV